MPTPERCLARAEEAERLAKLVSYERDRARLLRQAQDWRDRAAELSAAASAPSVGRAPAPAPTPGGLARLRRWLGLPPR